jgi:hypothetical protein
MEIEVSEEFVAQPENATGSELSNYTLDPALCGNVTTEYARVRVSVSILPCSV